MTFDGRSLADAGTQTSYTPGWFNGPDDAAMSIAGGTLTGTKRYRYDGTLAIVEADMTLVRASGTNTGTGYWYWTIGETFADFRTVHGQGYYQDVSAGLSVPLTVQAINATRFVLLTLAGTRAGAGDPITWATGDVIAVQLRAVLA